MIKHIQGDLLTVTKGMIVHQVNCKGVMGKGLALQIKNKWPIVYDYYKDYCNFNTPLGEIQIVPVAKDLYVCNLFGQLDYAAKYGEIHTQYDKVFNALAKLATCLVEDYPEMCLYIPKNMGCALGGGDWHIYFDGIKKLLGILPNDIYIVDYRKNLQITTV